jgi:tetratricopeptide (TPR) repeat protein
VHALYNLGTLFYREGRMDEAVSALKQAIERKPNYTRAHYNLGLAYVRQERLPMQRGPSGRRSAWTGMTWTH